MTAAAEIRPLAHLICGSTGAGKTTYALQVAGETGALLFSIDDWMTRLFGPDQPSRPDFAWMMSRVERCEAQMRTLAAQAGTRGMACVIDCGLTKAAHRARWAGWARDAGFGVRLHHLDVVREERWLRVQRRNAEKGETYRLEVTRPMFDFVERLWEPPSEGEMATLDGVRVR